MNWEEACRILGIMPTATEQEINKQYRYKVQLLHPDWNLNKPLTVRERAEEELKQVNEAYKVLKDSINNPLRSSPKLDISSGSILFQELDFGQKQAAMFEIRSVGGAYSKIWIDDSPAPWLRVTDVKSLTGELLPLAVTIEATGSGEAGKRYFCKLVVRLENEQTKAKDEAVVEVELSMKAEPGVLKVGAKNVSKIMAGERGQQKLFSFELSNIGRGWLKGHLFTTRPWLSVSSNVVNIAPSAKTEYMVTLATGALKSGFSDKVFVNIITDGGYDRVPVEISAASFSMKNMYRSLIYIASGCAIVLAPVVILPVHLSPNIWSGPLLWVASSIYLIYLTVIGGAVYWLYSLKNRKG